MPTSNIPYHHSHACTHGNQIHLKLTITLVIMHQLSHLMLAIPIPFFCTAYPPTHFSHCCTICRPLFMQFIIRSSLTMFHQLVRSSPCPHSYLHVMESHTTMSIALHLHESSATFSISTPHPFMHIHFSLMDAITHRYPSSQFSLYISTQNHSNSSPFHYSAPILISNQTFHG